MPSYRDSWLTRSAILVFFIAVVLYAGFEARGILFGPRITITSTTAATSTNFITITGHADRIATLTMNGAEIPVTENGDFSEPYLLAPGDNTILFDAKDRYGHSVDTNIRIYSTAPIATGTNPQITSTSSPKSTGGPSATSGSCAR